MSVAFMGTVRYMVAVFVDHTVSHKRIDSRYCAGKSLDAGSAGPVIVAFFKRDLTPTVSVSRSISRDDEMIRIAPVACASKNCTGLFQYTLLGR